MSYLLEALARGWVGRLSEVFQHRMADDSHCRDHHPPPEAAGTGSGCPTRQAGLGLEHLRAGRISQAREALESALRPHGGPQVRIGLACCCDELGLYGEAASHLEAAADEEPRSPDILFGLAWCHERRGNGPAAIAHYLSSLQHAPGLVKARQRLAAIYLRENRLEDAVEQYTELVINDPGSVDLHLVLAHLHLRAGAPEQAIEEFERALTIEPDNWRARTDLVETLEQAGLLREAIEHLLQVTEQSQGGREGGAAGDVWLRLGDLYERAGQDREALQAYLKALDLHPGCLEAAIKAGTQHLRTGSYLEAANWFSRGIEINDRLLGAYVGLGVAQHEAGHRKQALASFELASNIEPNSTLLYSEVARLQLKCAIQQEAQAILDLVPESPVPPAPAPGCPPREPVSPAIAEQVADLVQQQIERHQRLALERPNHPDVHYRLGLLLRQRGRLEEAIVHLGRAVEINPTYSRALIKLGLALSEAGRSDEAIAALRRALDLNPEYVDLHYRLGLIFSDRRQFDLAVEHFDRAVAGNPENLDFRENLAVALENMGLIDRARAMWHRISEMTPQGPRTGAPRSPIGRSIKG